MGMVTIVLSLKNEPRTLELRSQFRLNFDNFTLYLYIQSRDFKDFKPGDEPTGHLLTTMIWL